MNKSVVARTRQRSRRGMQDMSALPSCWSTQFTWACKDNIATKWTMAASSNRSSLPSGDHVFAVVDYYSLYIEIQVMKSTTTDKIIASLKRMFLTHGLPISIVTVPNLLVTNLESSWKMRELSIVPLHHCGRRRTEKYSVKIVPCKSASQLLRLRRKAGKRN